LTATAAPSTTQEMQKLKPEIHPGDPYLHMIPGNLHRYYRPLPWLVQLMSGLVATYLAALTTWKMRLAWWRPLSILRGIRAAPTLGQVASLVCKSLVWTCVAQGVLQEVFGPPSRISMQELLQRYFLPSSLSQYRQIAVPPEESSGEGPFRLGVHYLEYVNGDWSTARGASMESNNATTASLPPRFDALYLQHGFGASSLSWLPAIPMLVHRMRAQVGLGHDAVGFGFTERPEDLKWYTSKQSARVAQQILLETGVGGDMEGGASRTTRNKSAAKSIALMGHSMGALAILRLATALPENTAKFIILSSPALGINKRSPLSAQAMSKPRSWLRRTAIHTIATVVQRNLLQPMGVYFLRRVIGTKCSWKAGLKAAWGDPRRVSDSDVLRFSWPAIGLGWENGIIKFARAQAMLQEDELDDDKVLMQRVLELPHTKVAVILGSKDRIVSSKRVLKFMEQFPQVPIVELDCLGHDAFEEDTGRFCDTVDQLLVSADWDEEN
jgi:pimeloyl-ACP methyl ester carboxylesterase